MTYSYWGTFLFDSLTVNFDESYLLIVQNQLDHRILYEYGFVITSTIYTEYNIIKYSKKVLKKNCCNMLIRYHF